MHVVKKLIFFSRDLKIGGMEKALVLLLNSLSSDGYDVSLVLEKKEGVLLRELDNCIKVYQYRTSRCKLVFLRKSINLIHRLLWGLTHYRKYDFSCNYATYSFLGSKLALLASDNSALYVHSDYYEYFAGDIRAITSFFKQHELHRIKNILFVSRESKEKIEKIFVDYSSKFYVISNLIDYKSVIEKSKEKIELNIPLGKQLIVFVGRLEESSKKISRLIESFDLVVRKSNDYYLLIIGSGQDMKRCEELIKKHDLENSVKMIGETLNPYAYINRADCVILTSDFEGFPVVYNECLILKTPVITTIPVSDEFLDYRNYSVLVKKNSKQISECILNRTYEAILFDDVDIQKINENRLKKIKGIIDRKV